MCVSSWSRSWCASTKDHGGFGRAADHRGNRGGDSAGDKVVDMLDIVQRQVLGETEQKNCGGSTDAAFSGSSSSWTRLLTRPLVCNVRRVVQTLQRTMVFLQLQLSDGFVPDHPGSFRALHDEEFFVIEGSLGVALTRGVLLPGVTPHVDALISG